MNTVKTGGFLALLRKETGLTQEELGCEPGVTNKTVSQILPDGASGRFRLLKNDLNGYLISAGTDPDADYTLWLLYFESGENCIYVTFNRSAENSSLSEITDRISTFSFI